MIKSIVYYKKAIWHCDIFILGSCTMNEKIKIFLHKYKYVVNVLVLGLGGFILLIAVLLKPDDAKVIYDILIGIGGSVVATVIITLLLLKLLPDDLDNEKVKMLDEWGICHIHSERRSVALSGKSIPKYRLDYIAFGLKHFREANSGEESDLVKKIRKGLNVRIITLHPKSLYVTVQQQLEKREGLYDEIMALEQWKESILDHAGNKCKGNIQIKYYNSLPLDFYCYADGKIFVGPYVPGRVSGSSITYEFTSGDTKGSEYYEEFFDRLWEGKILDFIDLGTPYLIGDQERGVVNALEYFGKELAGSNKPPIGIVVMFKGEKRRTIFSCNKNTVERNKCYPKDMGIVGDLIEFNRKSEAEVSMLFVDFKNKLAFAVHHTEYNIIYKREEYKERTSDDAYDSEVKAILAIPIISNSQQIIGAITFDFSEFPKKYSDEINKMKAIGINKKLVGKNRLEVQRWFELAESCKKIIQPMLGSEINPQFKKLFEEAW